MNIDKIRADAELCESPTHKTVIEMCDRLDFLEELLYGTKRERKGLSIGDTANLTEEAKRSGNQYIARVEGGEITSFIRYPTETYALAFIKMPKGKEYSVAVEWLEAKKEKL